MWGSSERQLPHVANCPATFLQEKKGAAVRDMPKGGDLTRESSTVDKMGRGRHHPCRVPDRASQRSWVMLHARVNVNIEHDWRVQKKSRWKNRYDAHFAKHRDS